MVEVKHGVPMVTLEQYEEDYADRHLVHGVVDKWAREKPDAVALVSANDGREFTWHEIKERVDALGLKLVDAGFQKGDFLATSLPFVPEHVFLMYACFQVGVVHVPLDIRLKGPEVCRCVELVHARAYAHLGKLEVADFSLLGEAVKANCPYVETFIQFSHPDECIEIAVPAVEFARDAERLYREVSAGKRADLKERWEEMKGAVGETDGCQVIYTTGSTGFPKPALLSHRGITAQNLCLATGFGMTSDDVMLVNLPPSHVGGQAEQLMTAWFVGGKNVLLNLFDERLSLEAIQKYGVTVLGQIPALFNYEWNLPDYDRYDLSSLRFALYGGQAVSRQFLEKLATMAPKFGTGLGLTELSGFCTYTPLDGTVDDILAGVGYAMPITPLTIREKMGEDGRAGPEKKPGEVGEICLAGPQVFLGYVNDEENTRKTISSDGWCYTGDLGYYDEKGLHFAGRSKLMIKPKGYNVFPTEVENFIADNLKDRVEMVGVVGVKHDLFTEAIMAWVEKKEGADLTAEEVNRVCRGMAAYKRPSHVEVLEFGKMPLNRVNKTDYVRLKKWSDKKVEELRAAGEWDRKR
ncbi:MAG: class I adenylate-forming enzyme family protein [Promethearchaeota archaeon]